MSDYIDRQAAIEALRRAEALTRAFGYHNVIETIRELPSVQPQRMRGRWIPQGWNDTYCKCSCCDAVYVTAEIPYNYCPNCGADMMETG